TFRPRHSAIELTGGSRPVDRRLGGEAARLADPVLARDPSAKAQALVDPGDVLRGERRDLPEMPDPELMQGLLDAGADAVDLLEVVRLPLRRRQRGRRYARDGLRERRGGDRRRRRR